MLWMGYWNFMQAQQMEAARVNVAEDLVTDLDVERKVTLGTLEFSEKP